MSDSPPQYKRLPGRATRSVGNRWLSISRSFCSLWQGSDHLLVVDRTGYTESYKRFYYRDIQAVVIRRTPSAKVTNLVLLFIILVCGAYAVYFGKSIPAIIFSIITGILGFFLLINVWRGASCVTHIKTAVQTEQLPPWNRLKTARKGMNRIRPLLNQAQGEISADELRVRLEDMLRQQTQGPL